MYKYIYNIIRKEDRMALTENQVQDVISTALIKAWEDEQFKEQLIASPIETIERLTGERLSFKEKIRITAFETTNPESFELELPGYLASDDKELNEEELEMVTGGGSFECSSIDDFTNFLNSYL